MNMLCYVGIPQRWESPKGVLMRTALHNGYSNVAYMCASLEVPCYRDCLDLLTEHSSLFWKLQLEAPELIRPIRKNLYSMQESNSPYLHIDDTIIARLRLSRNFRYCPICLMGELITVFQDIKSLNICPFHQVLIIEQCPKCGNRERWTDAHLLFCKCGFNRKNAPKTATKFIDTNKLETFGKNAYTKKLSAMTWTAEVCDEIWDSRKSNEDKTPPYFLDSIYQHAETMIKFQIDRFPGFTQRMHLAPWISSHPKLKSFAGKVTKENYTCSSECFGKSCCTMIDLLKRELFHCVGGRHDWPPQKRFMIENFKDIPDTFNNQHYNSRTKICVLIKNIDKKNLQLKLEKEVISATSATTHEAENLIDCDEPTITILTKNGYLHTVSNPGRGYPRLITKLSIEAFRKEFILLNEISSLLNTSTIKASHTLKKCDIKPHNATLAHHVYTRSIVNSNFNKLLIALISPHRTTAQLELDNSDNLTISQTAVLLQTSGRILYRRYISTGLIKPLLVMGEYRLLSNQIKEIEKHLQNNLSITQIASLLECGRKKAQKFINDQQLKHSFAISLPNGKIQFFYNKGEVYHLKIIRDITIF